MDNYSSISKILHRQFLNKGEILNFSLNKINHKSQNINFEKLNCIFITGLARAGTTSILQSLDSTNNFASLRYKYMPFILLPRLAFYFSKYLGKNNEKEIDRVHADGLKISSESPECLDEPYWINKVYKKKFFGKILKPHAVTKESLRGYVYLLDSFLKIENKKRILIKNNNQHLRIISLSTFLPNSKFLIIFRDPISHATSLLNLHKRLINLQIKNPYLLEYMNLIGHWEFGKGRKPFIYKKYQENSLKLIDDLNINYWLKQWIFTYEWIIEIFENKSYQNINLVCYEDLCIDENYKNKLYNKLGIEKNSDNFSFKIGKSNNEQNFQNFKDNKDFQYAKSIYNNLRERSRIF